MIRINLLPVKQLQAEVSRRRQITIGALVLGLAALSLAAVHVLQAYQLSALESELTGLRSELLALNTKIKEVGDLQNKIKELRGKNKIIDDLKLKKSGPVLVMASLASATPTTLWLTDLRESGGVLTMNGLAIDLKTVADFITGLEASKHFKGVELIETTEGTGPQAGFKRFSIKAGVIYHLAEAPAPAAKAAPSVKKEEKKS
jgi:type IV pilus assembly protein PilN